MKMELGIEPLARNALHAFIESPVPAAHHYANTVHRDREVLRVGHLIFNFPDSELARLRVRTRAADIELQCQRVKVLRTISIRPPEFGIAHHQLRRGLRIERYLSRRICRNTDRLLKRYLG